MSLAQQTAPAGTGVIVRIVPAALWAGLAIVTGQIVFAAMTSAQADWLGLTLSALTLFLGAVVASYSSRYMRADAAPGTFFVRLAGLVASVVLFLNSQTLIGLAVGWIASGLLLAALIGHKGGWAEARAAQRRTLRCFIAGDMALLAAFGLVYLSTGTVKIAVIGTAFAAGAPATAIAVSALLLVAALTRCATPPFAQWLLSSMTAPTPVSALMHAGMVNAGGFLLIRFAPVIEAAPAIRYAAVALGFLAAIWGIGIMAVRPDIKRSLAGSTVSQMGFMIMSCSLGAYAAALWHILAHGLFKAWLFLNAGSAVGMRAERLPALEPRMVVAVAAITLVAGSVMAASGTAGTEMVPLLLAIATGAATMGTIVFARIEIGSRMALAGMLIVLAVVHTLGVGVAQAIVPASGTALLPAPYAILLLAAFLGCWVWQMRRVARQESLPAQLYVRLLNLGNMPATNAGDRS